MNKQYYETNENRTKRDDKGIGEKCTKRNKLSSESAIRN